MKTKKTCLNIQISFMIITFSMLCHGHLDEVRGSGTANNVEISTDTLVLRLVDPNGDPVEGAKVGSWTDWSDTRPAPERARMRFAGKYTSVLSDKNGIVILNNRWLFKNTSIDTSIPLCALHESRRIGGLVAVSQENLGQRIELNLKPLCHVKGRINSPGLQTFDRQLDKTCVYIMWGSLRPFNCYSNRKEFDFHLPPGQYELCAYAERSQTVRRRIEIQPGQQELELYLDLPASRLASLFGHPAPELQQIKGWINGDPVTIGDLRGKVVLLDFWSYWCSPCVSQMPRLMDLYQKFKDQGLVVIAIHNDSIASIDELDGELVRIRKNNWRCKEPFLIALDGGGKTQIPGTGTNAIGATAAAYGVTVLPTTLLIDQQGILIQEFNPESIIDMANLEHLLGVGTEWREEFDEIYSLKENQVLKWIDPSFIELRQKTLNESNDQKGYPYTSFQWSDRLHINESRPFFKKVTLKTILEEILGFSRFDYFGPDELLTIEIPGDWIVRKGASKDEILHELERIIPESGQLFHFEKRQIVRDVLVVKGVFQFKPLSGTFNDTGIHVFSDKLDNDERGGGGQGSLRQFLSQLGSVVLDRQIVDQAKSNDVQIAWYWHLSGFLKKLPEGPDKTSKFDLLLNNLSRQTSLGFSKERQPVDVWYIVEHVKE